MNTERLLNIIIHIHRRTRCRIDLGHNGDAMSRPGEGSIYWNQPYTLATPSSVGYSLNESVSTTNNQLPTDEKPFARLMPAMPNTELGMRMPGLTVAMRLT